MKYCTILILLFLCLIDAKKVNKNYFYGYDDDVDIDEYSNIDYKPNSYNKRKAPSNYESTLSMTGPYNDYNFERSKMIADDMVALITMRINYNYTEFINNYNSKDDAMVDLQTQLSDLFFIDVVRINVTSVISGSVIANFTLFPRLSTTDIKSNDILTKYNNGYYTANAAQNLVWLTSSTISFVLKSPYKCNETEAAPSGFVCVYNYSFTVVPEEDKNITSQYVLTLVLSLVLGGGAIIAILIAVRWCMNKTSSHIVKRQRVQLAVRDITANYV